MNFTEEQFARWSAPPSETERAKMENAERAIRNALNSSEKLKQRNIRVFAQGSYRNRVNVRADSDVDIAVLCDDSFFSHLPDGLSKQDFGMEPATYQFTTFRSEVGEALVSHFGSEAVTPGDKAFDIKANTYRVEADVAPFFEHRRYNVDGSYLLGTEMRTTKGHRIINWPEQHYENGVAKNDRTKRTFKGCVRILKTLRYSMLADQIASADGTSSFLMECLIWNVPDSEMDGLTWLDAMRGSMAYLFNNTIAREKCEEWGEVSELKYLFKGQQPWTWESTHKFLSDCRDYIGYK